MLPVKVVKVTTRVNYKFMSSRGVVYVASGRWLSCQCQQILSMSYIIILKTDHAMGRLRAYCESRNPAKFGCFVLGSYISVSVRQGYRSR